MFTKHFHILVGLFLAFSAAGCGNKPNMAKDGKILASVNGIHLYEEDVLDIVPLGMAQEDSILFLTRYIQNWAEGQLLLQEAESDGVVDLESINERVEEYRHTLIYHEHVQALVAEKMDTLITDAQIRAFYDNNKANFELKDNILRAQYVIAPATAKKLDRVKKQFFGNGENYDLLRDFCRDAAYRCQMDDTTWISYDDLTKVIPIDRTLSPEIFLRRKTMEINDTALVYWVKINDYKIKESISPFEFVREEIKLILLNRRKKEFLAAYRKQIFDKALADKKIELNYP